MNIPLIAVNHMQGIYRSHFIKEENTNKRYPKFPFICLTVSGGHTQIVLVKSFKDMNVIGETLDDAAGEAFDKSAKTLGLPYPGGPLIDKYGKNGNKYKFIFGKHKVGHLNFSFSGIKTSIKRVIEKGIERNPNFINENRDDLCASIQYTIVDILIKKLIKASKELSINEIAIAGGVSANSYLRERLLKLKEKHKKEVYIPKFEYCTDNFMIISGYYKGSLSGDIADQSVTPKSRFYF